MDVQLDSLFRGAEGPELAAQTRAAVQADPMTILRAATLIATSGGMPPNPAFTGSCRDALGLLEDVPIEAVRDELTRCLLGRDVDVALKWLQEIGLIAALFPELEATVHLEQEPGRHHKDVWEHTVLVVKQAVPRPVVRWAALLHDIGKVPTRTFTRSGVHFHGHAEVGARMFDKICRRMPFERSMRRAIRFLIKHHLRSAQYGDSWSDSAVRRFYREMDEHLTDLLDLSRADITSRRPGRRRALLFQISSLSDRIDALKAEDAVVPPLPTGLGNAIMERFELPPSRLIGDIKRALEAEVERGAVEPHRDEAYYIAYLVDSGLLERLRGAS